MNKIKQLIDRQLGENYEDQFNTMGCHEKEQEKRELLEMLIEIAYAEYREFTTTEKNQMKLIEKHLKMKWNEIIAFLED